MTPRSGLTSHLSCQSKFANGDFKQLAEAA